MESEEREKAKLYFTFGLPRKNCCCCCCCLFQYTFSNRMETVSVLSITTTAAVYMKLCVRDISFHLNRVAVHNPNFLDGDCIKARSFKRVPQNSRSKIVFCVSIGRRIGLKFMRPFG